MIDKIYNEPCLETLSRMPDNFLDCVITSPPYWQLRDYGYPEQWGLEPTFQEYLEHLWMLMDEIYRVLKPEGTVWVNLGDTYGSFRGKSGTKPDSFERAEGKTQNDKHVTNRPSFMRAEFDKCLLLIPHRFAIGCIDRGWIVRNDIIWAKRNGMPESVTDRFTKKHEYFFFMTKSTKYYFDLDAVKDRTITKDSQVRDRDTTKLNNTPGRSRMAGLKENNYDTKNPGSVSDFWDIPTKPSSVDHYATYNDSLLKKPVLAGCPEGGIIYDPFMGSGTTAAVAIRAKRHFIGSEAGKNYFNDAQKLVESMLMSPTLF